MDLVLSRRAPSCSCARMGWTRDLARAQLVLAVARAAAAAEHRARQREGGKINRLRARESDYATGSKDKRRADNNNLQVHSTSADQLIVAARLCSI